MNLSRRHTEHGLELVVAGRLDAYWADHLSQEITRVIHGGVHHVNLHLGGVQYISSAGIRVLLKFHKQLGQLNGSLAIRAPSDAVTSVIHLTGLDALFVAKEPGTPTVELRPTGTGVFLERVALEARTPLTCRLFGRPVPFPIEGFSRNDCRSVQLSPEAFGLGLGALGSDFDDCRARFGEWLSVGGCAAYLPSDRAAVPDYALSAGDYRPESQVLYGMLCEGTPAWRTRFDGQEQAVPLSRILNETLDTVQAKTAGVVLVAETASLVGVALRKAPTVPMQGRAPFSHPEIREWLTFTPERAFTESVTLAVGIVSRQPPPELAAWLRPYGSDTGLQAHLHAAVFSYHPIRRDTLECSVVARGVFEEQTLRGLLHLVKDDRAIQGAGDSELLRGVCWMGPIAHVRQEDELR